MISEPEKTISEPEKTISEPEKMIPEPETSIPESEKMIPEPETTIPESEKMIPEPETTIPESETTVPWSDKEKVDGSAAGLYLRGTSDDGLLPLHSLSRLGGSTFPTSVWRSLFSRRFDIILRENRDLQTEVGKVEPPSLDKLMQRQKTIVRGSSQVQTSCTSVHFLLVAPLN
ncbi:hypothetical protein HID58_017876 [Brassica napus]|uniref:FAZ1 C-terminal region domain-containing protein n=1 Tax=Brassica napus TaxID=3708 RepID=A0ABQ8D8C0_BRANA|nr:hypothetical protein HID58_017876 [Brassica napus]